MADDTKLVSKTGVAGAAVVLAGVLQMFPKTKAIFDALPAGSVSIVLGILVVLFRRFTDGKTPKVV